MNKIAKIIIDIIQIVVVLFVGYVIISTLYNVGHTMGYF